MTTYAQREVEDMATVVPSSKGRDFVRFITSTDHKTIGYLYLMTTFAWFLIAGVVSDSVSQTIALVANGCVGEDLVRQLNEINFVLDSGSACTAAQMQPSHVLAALGMKSEGNLRITLHHGVTEAEVHELITAITSVVQKSR